MFLVILAQRFETTILVDYISSKENDLATAAVLGTTTSANHLNHFSVAESLFPKD